MLECPFCHEQVKPEGRGRWFECPECQNWLRLRVNQSGSRWLEAGYYANEQIHPLSLSRPSAPPARPAARVSRPSARDMDLETVREQRQRAIAKLRELEENIQRAITLRSENLRNEQLTSQYNDQLSRLTREQNEWKQYAGQLTGRENELLEEQKELDRQTRSAGKLGLAFWLGAIVSAAAIYAFSWLMGLPLNITAYVYLVFIALLSGLLIQLIAKIG